MHCRDSLGRRRRRRRRQRVNCTKTIMPITEMTSSRRKRCPTKIWFAAILLIYILPAVLTDQCQVPASSVTVTENVANGSMLLKINYTANQNWTIHSQFPPGYFELIKRNTSFYLITSKVLDYEVLKEKADGMIVNLQCKADMYSPVKFDVFIFMNKLNEFVPQFTQRAYNKTIAENARIGDVVFIASTKATDNDYNDPLTFEAVKYSQGKNPLDGISSGKFKMADPKTGQIVVADYLDYEKQKEYIIKLVVRDSGGNATSAKLSINIADVDEVGPTFQPIQCELKNIPCQIPVIYHTQIKAADKGPMTILPNAVKAVDMEADHFSVTYSLTEGDPIDVEKHFKIDAHTGSITKETEFPNNVTSPVTLFIKGEEQSKLKHSSVAILIIKILDRNSTIFVSTKSTDSSPISVGDLLPLLGVLLSASFVLSLFGLAFWIRQKRRTHQPLPGSKHYFSRPNLTTKVFPIRNNCTGSEAENSTDMLTTIVRHDDSDEMVSTNRRSSGAFFQKNFSANDPVKCCLKQVATALDSRQQQHRSMSKSLRSLALPISSERSRARDQFSGDSTGRSVKSEQIFLGYKFPSKSNLRTFHTSYSPDLRRHRSQTVTNDTLETYVSDFQTVRRESPSLYPMSRISSERRDIEMYNPVGSTNADRISPCRTSSLRRECHKSGNEKVDIEQRSIREVAQSENERPNIPTERAPPIPTSRNEPKRPTPTKPPRKFTKKERRQSTQHQDKQIRQNTILKNSIDISTKRQGSSLSINEKQKRTLNKLSQVQNGTDKGRERVLNSTKLSKRCGNGERRHSHSILNRKRRQQTQNSERAFRSLEKKLRSLEKSRRLKAAHSQTLEQLPSNPNSVRRQMPTDPLLPLKPVSNDSSQAASSSSAETLREKNCLCLEDSALQARKTPPPLPKRKTNLTSIINTSSTGEGSRVEEDDPQYVNVKYITLISDPATEMSERIVDFSYPLRCGESPESDQGTIYLEPDPPLQPCLESDLNIRAKLELILASTLKKQREAEKKKGKMNSKDGKNAIDKNKTIRRNSLPAAFEMVDSYSSRSSYSSEKDDSTNGNCLQSSENIFLGSTDVVWPDPETTLAALQQHRLAMEDYTAACLAKTQEKQTSPCASITSTSSGSSRCHFGRVNSRGQFVVDIPWAESNIRIAKTSRPAAIPFRDVETSMGVAGKNPITSGDKMKTSILGNASLKENEFPQSISFDGIDQYEVVHRYTVSSLQELTKVPHKSSETVKEKNGLTHEQIPRKGRETKAMTSQSTDTTSSLYSRSTPTSSATLDSSSQIGDVSIRSDCATVISSELYEPSDSDCETIRSLKVFDAIFDDEDAVAYSSAESDSQSVFRACHPVNPVSRPSLVCPSSHADQKEDETKDSDSVKEQVDNKAEMDKHRSGSYRVNVDSPDGVDSISKEPVLNAYKAVNEPGDAFCEQGTKIKYKNKKIQMKSVQKKKEKRLEKKTQHRLIFSDVY